MTRGSDLHAVGPIDLYRARAVAFDGTAWLAYKHVHRPKGGDVFALKVVVWLVASSGVLPCDPIILSLLGIGCRVKGWQAALREGFGRGAYGGSSPNACRLAGRLIDGGAVFD